MGKLSLFGTTSLVWLDDDSIAELSLKELDEDSMLELASLVGSPLELEEISSSRLQDATKLRQSNSDNNNANNFFIMSAPFKMLFLL